MDITRSSFRRTASSLGMTAESAFVRTANRQPGRRRTTSHPGRLEDSNESRSDSDMARQGQTICNPVSGERITFLQTAADTAGERLEFELELAADGRVPGAHVHPEQEERFHVLEGTMTFRLGMRRIVASAGETVVVPARSEEHTSE